MSSMIGEKWSLSWHEDALRQQSSSFSNRFCQDRGSTIRALERDVTVKKGLLSEVRQHLSRTDAGQRKETGQGNQIDVDS
jgi:hypothetical protein